MILRPNGLGGLASATTKKTPLVKKDNLTIFMQSFIHAF
jgi:hypothetical protein